MTTGEIIALIKAFGGSGGGGGSSGGGVLVVHDVDGTLDKTWQEIHDAQIVSFVYADGDDALRYMLVNSYSSEGTYYVVFGAPVFSSTKVSFDAVRYTTSSASGYPVYAE